MSGGAAFRGQPLLLLVGLLIGWAALRAAFWHTPFPDPESAAMASSGIGVPRVAPLQAGAAATAPARTAPLGEADKRAAAQRPPLPALLPPADRGWSRLPVLPAIAPPSPAATGPQDAGADGQAPAGRLGARAAIGHTLLLLAGLSQMELPEALTALLAPASPPAPAAAAPRLAPREVAPAPAGLGPIARADGAARWSGDGWVLLRRDTDAPRFAGRSGYGRSQAGAVVRYRLAAGRAAPQAYLRGSVALDDPGNDLRESEVAVGLSARPVARLPVRLAAEARVTDTDRGARLRPAAFAVSEFPPVALPLGTRGELYLQAGYVGGDDGLDTAFVDGQARIDRPLAQLEDAQISAGAGIWGGAQEDASRLDIGPSAAASFSLGRVRARIGADYRVRVAGESRPASGPALTLSAGF